MELISDVLKTMPHSGVCDVDINKTIQTWDKSWSISQWKEEYKLVKVYPDGDYGKVTISKQQAHELIGKLNLIDEKSSIYNHARTWRQAL